MQTLKTRIHQIESNNVVSFKKSELVIYKKELTHSLMSESQKGKAKM